MRKSSNLLWGTVLAAGILGGSITAFAATSNSTSGNTTSNTASSSTSTTTSTNPHRGGGPRGHHFLDLATAASTIGITEATLQSDLQSGQSIAAVAQSKGVSEQTVIDALEKANQADLAADVTSGRITATQEQSMMTGFNNNVKQLVEQTGGFGPGPEGFGGPRGHHFLDLATVASTIGISEATLQSDLQSGQSISAVAQSKGVSEQTVIDALEKANQTRLAADVTSGKITAAQEQSMMTDFNNNVKQLVEQTGELDCGPQGHLGHFVPGSTTSANQPSTTTANSTSSSGSL